MRTNAHLIQKLELSSNSVESLISRIRDDIFKNTEITAFSRIENAKTVSISRKAEFTEELEGRLRDHW
jgi:DNA helicase HerA-like ATPase